MKCGVAQSRVAGGLAFFESSGFFQNTGSMPWKMRLQVGAMWRQIDALFCNDNVRIMMCGRGHPIR